MPTPHPVRFYELDGLRGIACLLVVIHQTFTSSATRYLSTHSSAAAKLLFFTTASGVECFFCLSGFILLYPYLKTAKPLNVSSYSLNRIRRIYPPFIVAWLLAGLVQFTTTKFPTWYSEESTEFMTLEWLRQANLVTLLACDTLYNSAWWSLTVECVWYVIVPLLVWASMLSGAFRGSLSWMLWTAASVPATLLIDSQQWAIPPGFVGPGTTLVAFVSFSTCFASAVWLLVYAASMRVLIAVGCLALATIAYSGFTADFRLIHVGFGLGWSALIGICMRADSLRKALSAPGFIWLGERSYSLFLTHMTVFVFSNWVVSHWCPTRNAVYGILTRAMGLPLALFVAMALFWFVERHFAHRLETAGVFWPPLWNRILHRADR